ncbi:hypothetical protein ATK30_6857 [Amycolatopsis echigonensis]|uniref:Uncharacterized protein n=1 Tax=Amycolatopsis echigonensis TaxID=2576905 RepID=A0A2N3WPY6_9PSEU|nr:hypothetical protein [Amycolatopsis niigatensis]PKV95924.1 hypothetical protein ATK30_6857 [Amycolatopsis niigatensis]
MPTPRKKTASPRRATARKTAASSVLQLDRQENIDAIQAIIDDREPLFSVGGVEYTIPKKAPAAWTIQATKLALEVSDSHAIEYALKKMLGDDGYQALAACETLTAADFDVIRDAIVKRVVPPGPKAS